MISKVDQDSINELLRNGDDQFVMELVIDVISNHSKPEVVFVTFYL